MDYPSLRNKILASLSLGFGLSTVCGGCHHNFVCNTTQAHDETPVPGCTVHVPDGEVVDNVCLTLPATTKTCPSPAAARTMMPSEDFQCFVSGPTLVASPTSSSGGAGGGTSSSSTGATSSSSGTGGGEEAQCCYATLAPQICEGRPFTVDGVARTADVVARQDWLGRGSASSSPPSHALLATAWEADAASEHASIASFARFIQELLAFGAPADLIRSATRAMSDEIAHAEACFALASRFGGAPRGPGDLRTDDAPPASDLATAVRRAVVEGCVGETISALVAEDAHAGATDEEVRRVLHKIVRDESRHAELAYRFVAWAIERGGEAIRIAAREALLSAYEARGRAVGPIFSEEEAGLFRAHGRSSLDDRRRITERTWSDVITPCMDALLGCSHAARGEAVLRG